ncbi:MAG TPA: hypothetical protein PK954_02675, partial [Anaerolineales bacterium]|nr:hypothetical protein [Anaerolineales bacterium]
IHQACVGVAGMPLLFDVAGDRDQTLYLGFTNTVQGVGLLATGLSGVVVETLGFTALLAATLLGYASAILASLRLARTLPPTAPH